MIMETRADDDAGEMPGGRGVSAMAAWECRRRVSVDIGYAAGCQGDWSPIGNLGAHDVEFSGTYCAVVCIFSLLAS